MNPEASPPKRNNDIEVLRAIAILFVLAQHIALLLPVHVSAFDEYGTYFGLWTGVDLFFVISGYVITVSLGKPLWADDHYLGRQAAYVFWVKRIFRLLPTAWLWLLLPLLAILLLPPDPALPTITDAARGAAAAILQVHNVYQPLCNEFLGRPECSPQFAFSWHYWSLSLEEQFYIVYPLLLLTLKPRHAMFGALIFAIVVFFWNRPPFSLSWYLRIDGFLWGIFLALASRLYREHYYRLNPVILRNPLLKALTFLGLLFLLARLPASHAGTGFLGFTGTYSPYSAGMIAVVGAALVWIASYNSGYV